MFFKRSYLRTVLLCAFITIALHAIPQNKQTDLNTKPQTKQSKPVINPPDSWLNFRGPIANGLPVHANPPLTWNTAENQNILWKTKVPKHGMSSPIVTHNRVFLTTADHEARHILCYDANTGKQHWQHDITEIPGSPHNGQLPEVLEETGYAAPTPATDGKHIVALFGTGELVCVDLNGKRKWAIHLGIPFNHYGHASSLIIHKNLVLIQMDQDKNAFLKAIHINTGKQAWHVKRTVVSWSSPILINNRGRPELILTNCKSIDSYDPNTGKQHWSIDGLRGEIATSPTYANGLLFITNENAAGLALDISNHNATPKIKWQWDDSLPDASSPVANDKYLIVPTAYGVVSCLDTTNGKLLWEHEFKTGFSSSPILVNDTVYILDYDGRTQIFKMHHTFKSLGTPTVNQPTFATPAFVNNRIYLRTLTHLFCISKPTNQ